MDETQDQNSFSFLKADERREDMLAELIENRVKPIIRNILRRKFLVSLSSTDDRRDNQDALDVMGDVISSVLPKLRNELDECTIEHVDAYVRTATLNAYHQYLRKKYPQRLRLTNQLRYLLTHKRDLGLWESSAWLCGMDEWRDKNISPASPEHVVTLCNELQNSHSAHSEQDLSGLVIDVFALSKRPLLFADLVALVSKVLGVAEREPQELGLDLSSGEDVALDFENKDLLKRLWEGVLKLPHRHRCAVLLNLCNSRGEGLIALLPATRVASIRQIAAALEFEPEEFARIWNELPWDDLRIASHLKITRQQVINLRQSARTSLRRRLKK